MIYKETNGWDFLISLQERIETAQHHYAHADQYYGRDEVEIAKSNLTYLLDLFERSYQKICEKKYGK